MAFSMIWARRASSMKEAAFWPVALFSGRTVRK
jgi:hypothetical protein